MMRDGVSTLQCVRKHAVKIIVVCVTRVVNFLEIYYCRKIYREFSKILIAA